nr:unnamed protein product [Callosobruchus chinensis]CAH7758720.1 unnamed protein product [Callosobruchus chinensis]
MYRYKIVILLFISSKSLSAKRLDSVVDVVQSKDVNPTSSIPPDASTDLVKGNCTNAHPPDVGYTLKISNTYPSNASATVTFSRLSSNICCITAYNMEANPHSVAYIANGGLNYDYVSIELRATDPHYGMKYNITVYLTDSTIATML